MNFSINKVAVLGAGVMGSRIAAHIVGAGIPVLLLDAAPNELNDEEKKSGLTLDSLKVKNRFAEQGKARVLNPQNKAIYDTSLGSMIKTGNFSDDLKLIEEVDWIIEVIVEDLEIKKNFLSKVNKYRRPGTIVSTNTSGISINRMIEDLPIEFRQHFLGTHFFNPPRFMRLLEFIPSKECLAEIVDVMKEFGVKRLGKGVVIAKDTPNFIANRIGTYGILTILKAMELYGYNIAQVDQITGAVMGRPKSATFRTLDMVGIDVFKHVVNNVANNTSETKEIEEFQIPDYVMELINNGWLGDKTRQGFYKKVKTKHGKEILSWDYINKEYVKQPKEKLTTIVNALKKKKLSNRLSTLVYGEDKVSQFAWQVIKKTLLYSANKASEICNDYKEIDKAMMWGFNWELGPFATWDAIGLEKSVERMKKEGEIIPGWIENMLKDGRKKFYSDVVVSKPYIVISDHKNKIIKENKDASLIDLGEGVACLEFHSVGNSINNGIIGMIYEALEEVNKNYQGLVLGNQSKNFSVGADLKYIGKLASEKKWKDIEQVVDKFQKANMALKYASKPVVAAPYRMTLGGGAEIVMHSHLVTALSETYMGLVEVGVGLIPSGGGIKEMLLSHTGELGQLPGSDLLPSLQKAWEKICMANVSGSGHEAIKLGLLKKWDKIIMSEEYLINEAKNAVLYLAKNGFRVLQPKRIKVLGTTGRASLAGIAEYMLSGGFISSHDALIAKKVAKVITGGNVPSGVYVTEEQILQLEKEAFVSLCGEEKTLQRIEHMLTKGKPLRN